MSNESLTHWIGDTSVSVINNDWLDDLDIEEEDVKDEAYYEHMNHIKLNEDSI